MAVKIFLCIINEERDNISFCNDFCKKNIDTIRISDTELISMISNGFNNINIAKYSAIVHKIIQDIIVNSINRQLNVILDMRQYNEEKIIIKLIEHAIGLSNEPNTKIEIV